jgi:hypothetical protein
MDIDNRRYSSDGEAFAITAPTPVSALVQH